MLFHFEQINALAGGDEDFRNELIDIFLEQIPEFIGNMKNYFKEERWTDLAREAHTAKSSVLIFGMDKTGQELKKIQLFAEKLQIKEAEKLMTPVFNDLIAVQKELQKLRESN